MPTTTDLTKPDTHNWRGRLASSVELMRELSRYSDPEEMYSVFAGRMNRIYPTTRQLSLSRRGLESPEFRVSRYNLWPNPVNPRKEPGRLPVYSGGVLAELLDSDEPRVIDDLELAETDPAFEYLDGQRSLLSIPVYEHGAVANTLVVAREEPHAFAREQVPELVWMTNLFGRAMQTLALSGELRDAYHAADYELRVIADMQHSLLPSAVPEVSGLEVAAHYRTANRAGGDYYDFFSLPGGKLGVLIADVSGHGSPAAVLMAITHTLAHAYPESPSDPGAFLGYLNAHLGRRYVGTTGHFVTAFYAVFDPAAPGGGEFRYSSAGHVAPRLLSGAAPGWQALTPEHRLPLGVTSRPASYPVQAVPFAPGDQVLLFTDGLSDAIDRDGVPFGPERFEALLSATPLSAGGVIGRVLGDLDAFTAGTRLADDCTLVVVGRV